MQLNVLGTDAARQLAMRWKQLLERWLETMAGNWQNKSERWTPENGDRAMTENGNERTNQI
jgi:hypothetical protein